MIIILVIVVILAAAVTTILLLRGNAAEYEDEDKSIEAPTEYRIGETSVPALPVTAEEIRVTKVEQEPSAEEEQDAASGEEEQGEAPTEDGEEGAAETIPLSADAAVYRYEGLTDASALVSAYAELLTTADTGFFVVDDGLVKADPPDFTAETGNVRLARSAPEEGKVLSVLLAWEPEACTVTVDMPEGAISDPPEPESDGMSIMEAIDYMKSLSPSALGLEGDSMEEYNVYARDGVALVNGYPCIHLNIYRIAETTQTNVVAGSYFLSADQRHIYKLDVETGTVVEVAG